MANKAKNPILAIDDPSIHLRVQEVGTSLYITARGSEPGHYRIITNRNGSMIALNAKDQTFAPKTTNSLEMNPMVRTEGGNGIEPLSNLLFAAWDNYKRAPTEENRLAVVGIIGDAANGLAEAHPFGTVTYGPMERLRPIGGEGVLIASNQCEGSVLPVAATYIGNPRDTKGRAIGGNIQIEAPDCDGTITVMAKLGYAEPSNGRETDWTVGAFRLTDPALAKNFKAAADKIGVGSPKEQDWSMANLRRVVGEVTAAFREKNPDALVLTGHGLLPNIENKPKEMRTPGSH